LSDKIQFTLADATDSGLPDGEADFVWDEDAWCYVVDKAKLTYDALKIIGFDLNVLQAIGGEMEFMQGLAHTGKIAQGRFIARKN